MIAVFPGQGSQHVGMAKELFAEFKLVREIFEEASDAVHLDLRKLSFDGPESDLTLTEHTQPCLLTASVSAFRVAEAELGFKPAAVAGHSLGEYSALVAAGVFRLGPAARWVRERGAAMQKAVPAGQGTMAAIIGIDDPAVLDRLCAKATENAVARRTKGEFEDLTVEALVQPANFNSPGQVVVAGSTDAVAECIALVKAGQDFPGGKAIPLAVSAPFHCSLMGPARERMAELFSQAGAENQPKLPVCPYAPNRTARLTREPGLVFELLIAQVDHPVLWKQSMNAMIEAGHSAGVEFGPGKVLQGLAKRIAMAAGKPLVLTGVNDVASLRALETQLKAKP